MDKDKFSKEELEQLFKLRHSHNNPRVRKRIEAIYFKASGLETSQICKLVRITRGTLLLWLKLWHKGGIEALTTFSFRGGRPCGLRPFQALISAEFQQSPPKTLQEAQMRIEQITGVKRAQSSIREFLLHTGLRRKKQKMEVLHETSLH